MHSLFKRIAIGLTQVIGAIIIMFVAYFVWLRLELNSLEELCTDIQPGDRITALVGVVEEHGFNRKWVQHEHLKDPRGSGYILFIPAASTLGEITCTVRYNDEVVLSAAVEGNT